MRDCEKKVCAIIVTYKREKSLLKLLNSLGEQTQRVFCVLIIDNTPDLAIANSLYKGGYINKLPSENEKTDFELKVKCKVHYIKLKENLGGAGGFNHGVRKILEEKIDFDFLWFFDDDALPEKDCLENLLRYTDKYKVVVPLRLSEPINFHEFPALRFNMKNPFLKEVRDTSNYRKYGKIQNFPEIIEVEDFSFEGPLISKDLIEELGPPRADIFISGDDTDYALKIRYKLKEKIALIRDAKVYRLSEEKKETLTPLWKEYYLRRNYYFTHREYGENIFVKIKPFFLFILSLFNDIFKKRFSKDRFLMQYHAFVDSFKNPMPLRYRP